MTYTKHTQILTKSRDTNTHIADGGVYPFLDGVGLADGSLRRRDAAGDAAVALAHAP